MKTQIGIIALCMFGMTNLALAADNAVVLPGGINGYLEKAKTDDARKEAEERLKSEVTQSNYQLKLLKNQIEIEKARNVLKQGFQTPEQLREKILSQLQKEKNKDESTGPKNQASERMANHESESSKDTQENADKEALKMIRINRIYKGKDGAFIAEASVLGQKRYLKKGDKLFKYDIEGVDIHGVELFDGETKTKISTP